jgi:hypothetical protein
MSYIAYCSSYHLGNQVNVTASGVGSGTVEGFISRDKVCNWTTNVPNSWFCVDLGPNRSVLPTHYTLGYASGGNSCVPRHWVLQASNTVFSNVIERLTFCRGMNQAGKLFVYTKMIQR